MNFIPSAFKKYLKRNIGLILRNFTYFNTKVYFPKNSLIFRIACEEGIYDREIYNFIFTYLKEDGLFIDVGTNIGLLSVPVLTTFKTTKVISFEPSPGVIPFLQRTHSNSMHQSRWNICTTALGDFTGEVLIKRNIKIDSAFDSIKGDETIINSDEQNESIKITTLDAIMSGTKEVYSSIVLKIDVEGFEYRVLKGSFKFIEFHKPYIVIEVVEEYLFKYDITLNDFLNFAKSCDYSIYGLSTLNKISNLSELQLSLNKNLNFAFLPN